MNKSIVQLDFSFQDQIIDLILKCLKNKDDISAAKILPTKKNAENFYQLEIFPHIFSEDYCFGYLMNDKLIAVSCCSTQINNQYECQEKVALGIIDMVDPDHRRSGVSKLLRKYIANKLKNNGINKVYLEIKTQNQASLSCASKAIKELQGESNLYSYRIEYNYD